MSTYPLAVTEWTQPAFVGIDGLPLIVVNGVGITQAGMEVSWSVEPELPEMLTASGLSIAHYLPESPLAPTTTSRLSVSGTVVQPSDITRDVLDLAAATTRAALLSVWFDFSTIEIWISDGSTTTLTTSRAFPWASLAALGVTSANRPARAYLTNTAAANELTVVYSGTPSAGEVLIDDTVDGTSVTLGAAPSAGTPILVQAHWLRSGRFEVEHSRTGLAEYEISFDFEELVPERSFT